MDWQKRLSRQVRAWLRSRILSRHGIALLAQARNGLFAVDTADFHVSRALLRHGQYASEEIDALTRVLAGCADPHLLFVGTHIGSVLIPLARATGARRIVAFEPSPANLRLLQLNLKLNGLSGVDVRPAAVGDRAGTIRFTQNRINTGNSRVARDRGELEVPIVTLDASVPSDWERIALMVMDVEGYEVHAMRGAAGTLARTRWLLVEFSSEYLQEQDCSAADFIRLVAANFHGMYLLSLPYGLDIRDHARARQACGRPASSDENAWPQFFRQSEIAAYLRGLPSQRGLVLNLLFSKEAAPCALLSAASTVCASSVAIVIGPTPPGTGV